MEDNVTNFQATFKEDGTEAVAKFKGDGEWLYYEKKMEYEGLPATVKDGFQKSKYTDWELRGVKEIHEKDKPVQYRLLMKKNSANRRYLFFNADGQLDHESQQIV
jgi:hypothetical protein